MAPSREGEQRPGQKKEHRLGIGLPGMSPAMMGHATDTSDMRASETKSIAMTLPFSPLRERARYSSPL